MGVSPRATRRCISPAGEPQPRHEELQKHRRERKPQDEDEDEAEEGQMLVSSGLFCAESLLSRILCVPASKISPSFRTSPSATLC